MSTCLCLAAGGAAVQEENAFAVGINLTGRMSPEPAAHGDTSIGVKWRFGHADTGWGWHYGLNWYSTNLDRTIDTHAARFGELKLRPFLGGYGYTRRLSPRLSVTGDVIGGFAVSSVEITPAAQAALHESRARRSASPPA